MPAFVHILTAVTFPRGVLSGIKSVSGDDSSLLGLEPIPSPEKNSFDCDSKILFQVLTVVENWFSGRSTKNAEIYPRGTGESSIRRHTSSATAHAFFSMTLLLCASSSDVERDLTSSSESPCRRLVIFTSGYFCLGGGGGRVRCFCVGICEGSCINPFWVVGGPRLFSQKISKISQPPPIKNVPSLNSYLLFDSSVFSHWYFILPLRDTRLTILTSK